MQLNRIGRPEWYDTEVEELCKQFMAEGDPDDEVTLEECQAWMYEHASPRMKAYFDSIAGKKDEEQ